MDISTQGTRAYELKSQPIQNLSERAIAEVFDWCALSCSRRA